MSLFYLLGSVSNCLLKFRSIFAEYNYHLKCWLFYFHHNWDFLLLPIISDERIRTSRKKKITNFLKHSRVSKTANIKIWLELWNIIVVPSRSYKIQKFEIYGSWRLYGVYSWKLSSPLPPKFQKSGDGAKFSIAFEVFLEISVHFWNNFLRERRRKEKKNNISR